MTSLSKTTNCPVFIVGPQPILQETNRPKHGQQTKLKPDQRRFGNRFRAAVRLQSPSQPDSNLNTYSRGIRFVDPKTQTRFTERQYAADERPTKRPKVTKYGRIRPEQSLSARKPVKTHVPADAWQLIFQRCDLAFLLKARLVCRVFRDILDRQTLWREAREYQYGDEIPNRPSGITDFQYATLLVGKGCQIPPCPRRDTRKVYWPFMLRMCDRCFNKMVEVPNVDCPEAQSYSEMYRALEPEVRKTIPSQLPGLLPAGKLKSSRWGGPRPFDEELRVWKQSSVTDTTIVLADDYEALRLNFNEKVQDDPDHFLFWASLKWGAIRERMSAALELEDIDLVEPMQREILRFQKMTLFAKKALGLEPPMEPEVLERFAAYQSALETQNAASLRSWDALRAKIDVPELRAQAEQLVRWEDEAVESSGTNGDNLYDRIREHRASGKYGKIDEYTPEQKVVIEIAYEELETLLGVVHDEDVLLMWFNQVRNAYESLYQKPEGLNGDGTYGPYVLTLDDALMIVRDILQPMLWEADRGLDQYRRILTSLRCMGCTRANTATTYDFKELIDHARLAHAEYVAKDSFWYRLAVPIKSSGPVYRVRVAWYHLPWFKTMPALPFHRKVTPGMIWNPDIETNYVQHEGERSPAPVFALPVTYQTRIPGDDFTSNFCRAVRTLTGTRLDSLYVVKVAFEYARRRSGSRSPAAITAGQLTVNQLQSLETICARFAPRLEFKFKCRSCAKERAESQPRRRQPKPQTLPTLVSHWQLRHRADDTVCVTERIVLPTEADLMDMMEREDAKLEAEKETYARKIARNTEIVDPRTAALLDTPSIRSCFDKLFLPPVEGRLSLCVESGGELETSSSSAKASFSSSDTQFVQLVPGSGV